MHVNVAKEYLQRFMEPRTDISVTYFVSGFVQESEKKLLLVRREHLSQVLSKLSTIESVHVYSVESDKKAKEEKSKSIHTTDLVNVNDEVHGKGEVQSLISKYFPNSSNKSDKAPSRHFLPWPKRQKLYQSTLWCPCDGYDEFGPVAKKIKPTFYLSDSEMEPENEDTYVNKSNELALETKTNAKGRNNPDDTVNSKEETMLDGKATNVFLNDAFVAMRNGNSVESRAQEMPLVSEEEIDLDISHDAYKTVSYNNDAGVFESDDDEFLDASMVKLEQKYKQDFDNNNVRPIDYPEEGCEGEEELTTGNHNDNTEYVEMPKFDSEDDAFLNEVFDRVASTYTLGENSGEVERDGEFDSDEEAYLYKALERVEN